MYLFYLGCQFKDLNMYKVILILRNKLQIMSIIEEYMYINTYVYVTIFRK